MSGPGWVTRTHGRLIVRLLKYRRAVTLAWILLAILAATALGSFRIETDLATFYPQNDPVSAKTRRLYGDTSLNRLLTVVLRADDPRRIDETLPRLIESLRESPYLARIIATREEWFGQRGEWVRQAPLYSLPDEFREKLKDRLKGPDRLPELKSSRRRLQEDPLAGKEIVLKDPLGIRWLFAEAAERPPSEFPATLLSSSPYLVFERPSLGVIRLVGTKNYSDVAYSKNLLDDVRPRIDRVLGEGPVEHEMLGGYVTVSFHSGRVHRDLVVQTVSSMVVILLFLFWFTRSLWVSLCMITALGTAILCTLSFGGAMLGPLTPLTVSVAAVLIAQGVDFPIHFYAKYRRDREDAGREEAFGSAHVSLGRLQTGAAATAVAAFLALLLSRFPGINQFGILLCMGLVLCLLAAVTVVPVVILAIDRKAHFGSGGTPLVVRLASALTRSRIRFAAAAAMVVLALASWAYFATYLATGGRWLDLDPRNIVPAGDPSEEAGARLERELRMDIFPVFVLLDETTPFDRIEAGCRALREQNRVGYADGPHVLFPGSERRGEVGRFLAQVRGWIEETLGDLTSIGYRSSAPFRPGLEEIDAMLVKEPPGREALLSDRFTELREIYTFKEGSQTSWVIRLYPRGSLASSERRDAFDRAVFAEFGAEARIISGEHMKTHYESILRGDLGAFALFAAVGVALVTLIVLRKARGRGFALIPVVIAVGVTLAGCMLVFGALNLVNMIAIPIVIGIAVHDGIYYVAHARGRFAGTRASDVVREVGPGIWGSTATTMLGFGALMLSVSPGLASLGLLVVLGRALAMISTLVILPIVCRPILAIHENRD